MRRVSLLLFVAVFLSSCHRTPKAETVVIDDAPFAMPVLTLPTFPERFFPITDYGAQPLPDDSTAVSVERTESLCTESFAAAIAACSEAGGGHVVVPAGRWLTGPIHLRSHIDLHLEEGAVVVFTDEPTDYLPPVQVSWEGLECMNYSPLVYAFGCTDIAITGPGRLEPRMDFWRTWFTRPEGHLEASKRLYTWGATDYPVEQRDMTARGDEHMRPHLIHLNRCSHVLLDGFTIRESPFWTIHLLLCEQVVARNLDVRAHGHNNDGIDLEMTRDVLVEDCIFDQGDDAVVIKSGRNRDAWRLHTSTENVVVRNCCVRKGHTLLGIGSEISGGVRNIWMHHIEAPDNILRLFFIKTNHRRGAFVQNVTLEDVDVDNVLCLCEIDTDVLYQWRDLVPTYDTAITHIDSIALRRIRCHTADAIYEFKGDARDPIGTVMLQDLHVDSLRDFISYAVNTQAVVEDNVCFDAWMAIDYTRMHTADILDEGEAMTERELRAHLAPGWRLADTAHLPTGTRSLHADKQGATLTLPFFGSNVVLCAQQPNDGKARVRVIDEWGTTRCDTVADFSVPHELKLVTPRLIIANYTLVIDCLTAPLDIDDAVVIWKNTVR